MIELIREFSQSLLHRRFLQLVLSQPAAVDSVLKKVSVRPVLLSAGPRLQFAFIEDKRETHENLTFSDGESRVTELLRSQFKVANLFLTNVDLSARTKGGSVKLTRRPPSKTRPGSMPEHNRTKQYLIPDGVPCPFLIEIGVMTAGGKVHAAKYDKFRQVNRFLELVNDVLPELPTEGVLRVVDFGCGKSYLTFALHHLLTSIHQREVEITGLDLKDNVIEHCNEVARKLGCQGLSFRLGDIAAHTTTDAIDMTVSLHACDTATDIAIAKAASWGTRVILSVPCCQHEFATSMTRDLLAPLQRHGILRERFAALTTDALRAQVLELLGYRTQVVEFIDMEHTPKNLLLRAVQHEVSDAQHAQLVAEYVAFKRELGLDSIAIEDALGPLQARLASRPS